MKKKAKRIKPRVPAELRNVSKRNRVHVDRKKKDSQLGCRKNPKKHGLKT